MHPQIFKPVLLLFIMINQMIVEGIRNGIKRGQSLRQAMISFYNAGYSRQDIEDSARTLQSQLQSVQISQTKTPSTNQTPQLLKTPVQNISSYISQNSLQQNSPALSQKPIQRQSISSYTYSKESFFESKGLVIFLLFILILCLGGLVAVLFFKQELVNFFNNLF